MRSLAVIMAVGMATLAGVATLARAESIAVGDLRVAFDARFSPRLLPRSRPAPVRVRLEGAVRSLSRERPPRLRRISIALNRHGRLFARGLPLCPAGRLQATISRTALERCGGALVGHGVFKANVDFPEQEEISVTGRALAFNGRMGNRRAILLHVHGTIPIQATVVLPFRITHPPRGQYGTVLTAQVPRIAAEIGYVTDLSMALGRRYEYRGRQRSFISAACAAPAGLPGAIFPFARGRFDFADGRTARTTLLRDCVVR